MQTTDLDYETLRRLADLHFEDARVLSVYLDLDPSEFATPAARATELTSVTDAAERRVRELDDLTHDQKTALHEDVAQVRAYVESPDFSPAGAHAVALFSARGRDFFEALRLPRSVPTQFVIDESPFVEPLADLATAGRWAVLLVNRKKGRLLVGSADRLEEVHAFGEEVAGAVNESGGGSVQRDDKAVAQEAQNHVRKVAAALFKRSEQMPIDRLVLGSPKELAGEVEASLHASLHARLAGHIEIEIEHSKPEDVLSAAGVLMEEDETRREREALDALQAGVASGGRGAAGLEATLAALNERRVETLLYEAGYTAAGVQCRSCGWIGPEVAECPVDAGPLDPRENVMESAVELTLEQAAGVMVVRRHDDLAVHGRIGAVLRF
jgi:peptide chain release factor subunit 1